MGKWFNRWLRKGVVEFIIFEMLTRVPILFRYLAATERYRGIIYIIRGVLDERNDHKRAIVD